MDYTINTTTLLPKIDELISQVADQAYSEDGQSLYDSIILTEKDADIVKALISDAANTLAGNASDICTRETGVSSDKLVFNIPDHPSEQETATTNAISGFIALSVCMNIFRSRYPAQVPVFEAQAQAALQKTLTLLRKRTKVTRS